MNKLKLQEKKGYRELNYVEFGKFIINKKRLLEDNILLIKYIKSFAPIPTIKRQLISSAGS